MSMRGTNLLNDRQFEIHVILKEDRKRPKPDGTLITAAEIAAELTNRLGINITPRTVQRDVEVMMNRRHLPIEIIRGVNGGYRYTEDVTEFPGLHLSKVEVFCICIAVQALAAYRNTHFEKPIRRVINKLLAMLKSDIKIDLEHIEKLITFRPGPFEAPVDLEVFETVCNSLFNQTEIEFEYTTPQYPDRPMKRLVQPLHLIVYAYAWYLFGNDLTFKKMRPDIAFALSRMGEAFDTGHPFTSEKEFDITKTLDGCFGIDRSGEIETVRLRFTSKVRQFVVERNRHIDQEQTSLPDGGIELTLRARINGELMVWLRGWGPEVKILEPSSLVRNRIDDLRAELRQYRAPGEPLC